MVGDYFFLIIGSYVASMNGIDFLCFTAGIGENSASVRNKVCSYLKYLDITLDKEANESHGKEIKVSTPYSKVGVYVIPTNEELAVARETARCILQKKTKNT